MDQIANIVVIRDTLVRLVLNCMAIPIGGLLEDNAIRPVMNRHLLETARALLIGAHVPRHHWDDAIVTAVHLINRMPSGVLTFKTPLQVLAQHKPLPSVLVLTPRIFGCVAFVHLHKNQRSKLDPCALRCVFVGYATHQKGYRCYHPSTRRTYVTLDVTFLESELFFHDPSSNSTLQGEIRSEEQNWSNLENEEILIYISDPSLTPTDNTEQQDEDPLSNSTVPTDQSPENILEVTTPTRLVHLENKTIGYQLPFRQNRGKAPNRYSPDISKTSKYPIANHVSTEKLSEPFKAFVHQLSAIHISTKVSEALKDPKWLRKALYGLKQSPRAWFGRFTMAMKNNGFKQCNSDHTLFLKHRKGKVTALIIYVDDMIITGNDKQEISQLQDYLATEFEMKDLGGLKYFLGIEVARSQQGIFLSQRKYVLDLLTDTGMLDCKPADTPIVQNHHLGEYPDQVPTNKERYQRLVGRLIYLSHTRPDIAY
ncbi:unnamed protein product, partial [Prunus brigantina]